MRRPVIAFVCLLGCWFAAQVWLTFPQSTSWAQEKSKAKTSKKKGNSGPLDVKANELQGGFIKSAEELAGEYYELKEYDKARMLLKSIQALDPDRPNLAAKLKLLDEDMINSNESEIEVNAAKGWEPANVLASAGKPIRLKAEGAYKFSLSGQLGPGGFVVPKAATPADMVPEMPLGALIGIIIPLDRAATGNQSEEKKNKPFLVADGCDYTPQKDGMLYLRINAPPDNKNTGKIKVQVSGGVRAGK